MRRARKKPKVYKKDPPVTELKVVTPWNIYAPRKTMEDRKYAMSLNTFLGLDPSTTYKMKKIFHEQMEKQLSHVVLQTPVEVTMQSYKPNLHRSDKGNWYAISAKFLYDSMTAYGVWVDDNDDFIKPETLKPSLYDKGNGRIEWTFKTVEQDAK